MIMIYNESMFVCSHIQSIICFSSTRIST